MPERAVALLHSHQTAVSKLDGWLSKAQRLGSVELHSEYRDRQFVAGWRIPAEFGSETRRLDILVTAQFPFSLPRIALVDRPPFLVWPHVERDGLLCLVAEGTTSNHTAFIKQVKELLGEAISLITECIAGTNQDDFRHEFYSYWSGDVGTDHIPFISLIAADGPSREIAVWRGANQVIAAESDTALSNWMRNRYDEPERPREFDPGALLWLPTPPIPQEYPKTSRDVWAMARDHAPDAVTLLQKLAAKSPKRITVILGASGKFGPCLGGVTAFEPRFLSNGRHIGRLNSGFRPGRTPASVLADRYWTGTGSVTRAEVSRADPAWIHGRGKDARQPTLRDSTVVIIGAGSLGAPVAIQLAMAGVSKLIIIDPDKMRYSNVGRHPLGANHVGEKKAEALAEQLRKSYPHSAFEFRNVDWRNALARSQTSSMRRRSSSP